MPTSHMQEETVQTLIDLVGRSPLFHTDDIALDRDPSPTREIRM